MDQIIAMFENLFAWLGEQLGGFEFQGWDFEGFINAIKDFVLQAVTW